MFREQQKCFEVVCNTDNGKQNEQSLDIKLYLGVEPWNSVLATPHFTIINKYDQFYLSNNYSISICAMSRIIISLRKILSCSFLSKMLITKDL